MAVLCRTLAQEALVARMNLQRHPVLVELMTKVRCASWACCLLVCLSRRGWCGQRRVDCVATVAHLLVVCLLRHSNSRC